MLILLFVSETVTSGKNGTLKTLCGIMDREANRCLTKTVRENIEMARSNKCPGVRTVRGEYQGRVMVNGQRTSSRLFGSREDACLWVRQLRIDLGMALTTCSCNIEALDRQIRTARAASKRQVNLAPLRGADGYIVCPVCQSRLRLGQIHVGVDPFYWTADVFPQHNSFRPPGARPEGSDRGGKLYRQNRVVYPTGGNMPHQIKWVSIEDGPVVPMLEW